MKSKILLLSLLTLFSWGPLAHTSNDSGHHIEPVCVGVITKDGQSQVVDMVAYNTGDADRLGFSYEDDKVAFAATVDQSKISEGSKARHNVSTIISVATPNESGKMNFIGAGSTSSGYWGNNDQVRNAYVVSLTEVYKILCYKDKEKLPKQ